MDDLITIIYEDIKNSNAFKNSDWLISFDYSFYHFSLGRYIRNKYLWNNKQNREILRKRYKKNHVDDSSAELLKEFLEKFNLERENHLH